MAYTCPRCGGPSDALPTEPTKNVCYVQDIVKSTTSLLASLRQQIQHLTADNDLLNQKFMDSVDQRSELEDNYAVSQMELERVQSENAKLQGVVAKYHGMLEQGHLVEATHVRGLMDKLAEERNSKMAIESELEDLSRDLFEEANKMVAAERVAHSTTVKRCSMLERRLKEMDELLASQKEQLTELKTTLEQVSNERDTLEVAVNSVLSLSFDEASKSPDASHPNWPDMPLIASPIKKTFNPNHQHRPSTSTASRGSKNSMHDSCYFSDFCESPVFEKPNSIISRTSRLSIDDDTNLDLSFSFNVTDPRFIEFQDFLQACVQRPATLITNSNLRRSSLSTTPLPSTSYHKFLKRIQAEDVDPTLHFYDPSTTQFLSFSRLQKRLNTAMACNVLVIEGFSSSTLAYRASAPTCTLCLNIVSPVGHHIYQYRIVDETKPPGTPTQPNIICTGCSDRLASVCAYHSTVRMIQHGLVKDWEPSRIYAELLMRRMGMWMARCGADVAKSLDAGETICEEEDDITGYYDDERTMTGIAEEDTPLEEDLKPWEGRECEVRERECDVRQRDSWKEGSMSISVY
ncbi:hypothetical protein BC937DRAFT_95013 [Endogone sp. FLAS-F59071]|nr:hypothetical protein BC937DRAFT_95013 [Endogone sp. FLAS-F59071]|eukprot:RUS13636.1 hypothetical protein BC937DRAFT_95013 [Endogone sp. FLAS-F59071]